MKRDIDWGEVHAWFWIVVAGAINGFVCYSLAGGY